MALEIPRTVQQSAAPAFGPVQVAAILFTGHNLFANGRFKEARCLFEGVALFQPGNAYAHGILGAIHQKLQNHKAAWIHYTLALRNAPNDIHLLTNRGELLLSRGALREAADDFGNALSLDPNRKHPMSARLRMLIAMTLEKLKETKQNTEGSKARSAKS
jgi:Flp pilus assembly protein TadD